MDLFDLEVDFKCPKCKHPNKVKIKQARDKESIKCGGCKQAIRLELTGDDLNRTQRALDKLQKTLSKTINIGF